MQTWLALAALVWVAVFALSGLAIAVGALVLGNDVRAAADDGDGAGPVPRDEIAAELEELAERITDRHVPAVGAGAPD